MLIHLLLWILLLLRNLRVLLLLLLLLLRVLLFNAFLSRPFLDLINFFEFREEAFWIIRDERQETAIFLVENHDEHFRWTLSLRNIYHANLVFLCHDAVKIPKRFSIHSRYWEGVHYRQIV